MDMQQLSGESALVSHLPVGFFVLDREWRFVYMNRMSQRFFQEVCHQPPEQLLGQSIWEKCPDVADSAFSKERQQAEAEKRTFELEVFYPELGRWYLMLASLSENSQYFYFRDTTDQKRLEGDIHVQMEHLRKAERGKTELLANLAQKVRSMLATLQSNFALARQGAEAAERGAAAGEKTIAGLSRLMDDVLMLAQLLLGRVEPRKERVDVVRLAAEATQAVMGLPESQGRIFTANLSPRPLWVLADPKHLSAALFHLVYHAVSQTRPGGHVSLLAETQHDQVVFQIEDDGVGLPPEVLPVVFELYVEGDSAPDRGQEKLRIGPVLVRHLIELQGGKVEASSDGPGRGSAYTIWLPEAAAPLSEPGGDPSRIHVLVVDKDAEAADNLAQQLDLWGYGVRVALDGPSALREVAHWRPLTVLLDVAALGTASHEVARLLQKQTPEAPILIALNGMWQEEDRQQAREAGFNYFLSKPVSLDEIRCILDSAVVTVRRGESAARMQ